MSSGQRQLAAFAIGAVVVFAAGPGHALALIAGAALQSWVSGGRS